MNRRTGPDCSHKGRESRCGNIPQRIAEGIRFAAGTLLIRPDGYLYPHVVRERASDILGLVGTLGHISTATAAQRDDIVSGYQPRQVADLVLASQSIDWTSRPAYYGALASRVVREDGEKYSTATSPRSFPDNKSQHPAGKRKTSPAKRKLTIVKNEE